MTNNKHPLIYYLILFSLFSSALKAQDPKGLKIGDSAPLFSTVDQFGNSVELKNELKKVRWY